MKQAVRPAEEISAEVLSAVLTSLPAEKEHD
jgi:hypothetical protein